MLSIQQFFSVDHIYGNPTAKHEYTASAFDPEGLFGSLTSIFQVWLGYQAGYIILSYSGHIARVSRWLTWSLVTGIIGAVLCLGSQNDGPVPVNKNLWSISFVMVTSCFAFALLSFLYIIIDVAKVRTVIMQKIYIISLHCTPNVRYGKASLCSMLV